MTEPCEEVKRVEQQDEKALDDMEKHYKGVLDKIRAEIEGIYRVILKGTPKDDWAVRWNDVLMAMLSFVWTLLSLVIAYHALWTLFGKHRLTISDKHCHYEARLGPRVKRKSFTLGQSPYAASFPGKSLRVLAADGNCHYCFDNLPPRCYLPLIVFVWHR